MKINQWSRDRLRELGINEADAKELRGLSLRLALLEETLLRETREMVEADGDVEPPLTPMEKRSQQLMNRVRQILDGYPELLLTAGENGGVALYRASDWLAALEGGGLEALEKVPAIEIGW